MKNVREPAVAGMFYPNSPAKLKSQIIDLLASANVQEKQTGILGIISPHAGYQYSGKTAAFAYNTIKDKYYSTVIIISPSHREYFPGVSIFNGDSYKTPLGEVNLNKELVAELTLNSPIIFESTKGHKAEHALEVQIPFLQTVLNNFTIVPLVMGDQRKQFVDELAGALAKVVDQNVLIVASSDLSHFYSKDEADLYDSLTEKRIFEMDIENLQADLDTEKCQACGGGPILSLLKTAKLLGKNNCKILSRTNSGDVTGDYSEVVGYLSAVVY